MPVPRKIVMRSHKQTSRCAALLVVLAAAIVIQGCAGVDKWLKTSKFRFLDPHSVVVTPPRTPITPILPNASPADPSEEILPNAEFPQESDYVYSPVDYVIGPTDVLNISIMNLFQPGLETPVQRQVEASGYIDLPLLPSRILAEGFTANELKHRIADAYSQTLLRDPTISVAVMQQRQNTFSILGTVLNPGTYEITRRDMRLLDAIALARGVTNPAIRYLYVIRPSPAIPEEGQFDTSGIPPAREGVVPPSEDNGNEVPTRLPPLPDSDAPIDKGVPPELPSTLPPLPDNGMPEPTPEETPAPPDMDVPPPPAGDETPSTQPTAALMAYIEHAELGGPPDSALLPQQWVYTDGRWVRQETTPASTSFTETAEGGPGAVSPARDADQADLEDPWKWQEATKADMARVIAINLEKLFDGDPRMNIIIRDNDIIHVPTMEVGEFYVMGEVTRPGVYSLTGRRITIKMAIAAAGNMSPLAWPEHSVLIRRIGENQEQIIPINVEKIYRGEESDIFLKPNDVIAVGTSAAASFMAVIRNAFRMTYGFGFIYDRNFAYPAARGMNSRRFTRW